MASVKSQWKHLANNELQDVDRADIKVILGSDVTEIIIPREVREEPEFHHLESRQSLVGL